MNQLARCRRVFHECLSEEYPLDAAACFSIRYRIELPVTTARPALAATPAPATGLAYQNPGGAGWRLARNPAKSTPTHLVLDLLAPPGTVGLGAGFNMTADACSIVATIVLFGRAKNRPPA